MDASEDFGGDFVGFEKVVKVGASVVLTTFAIAVGHEGSEVARVLGVLDVDAAVLGIEGTIAGHASRADAVESVATKLGANK